MEIECSLETINDEDLEEIYAEGVKRLREYFILGRFGTCQTMATKILHNFLKKTGRDFVKFDCQWGYTNNRKFF
jgi:hypothetical protein